MAMSMSSQFGGAGFYDSITLAVNATGAQAVQDLENHVQTLKNEIAAYQAKLVAGTSSTVDAQKELQKLAADLRTATEAAAAANRVVVGQAAALRSTESATRGASVAMLEFSRGVEDLATGGFLGVLNNIPGIVRGVGQAAKLTAPQVAALETGISLVGTAAYVMYRNWDTLTRALGGGHVLTAAEEMRELAKATERTADQEERLQKLRERAKNEKEQGKEPDAESDFKSGVNKAISEGPVSDIEKGIDKHFGKQIQQMADIANPKGTAWWESPRDKAEKELESANRNIWFLNNKSAETDPAVFKAANDRQVAAQRKLDSFYADARKQFLNDLPGNKKMVAHVADVAAANPADFGKGGLEFSNRLKEASPELLALRKKIDAEFEEVERQGEESIRGVKDKFDQLRRDEKTRGTEKEQRTNKDAARVGPGVDESLEKSIYDQIKGGSTPEAAAIAKRPELIHTLRGRGVGEDVVGDVASKILEKASDAAQNLLAEDRKPRLDVKAETAKTKIDDARKTAVDKAVGEVDQVFADKAVDLMVRNDLGIAQGLPVARSPQEEQRFRARGQNYSVPPNVLSTRIDRMIASDLQRGGKDPALAPEIRTRAADLYDTKKTQALANTPMPDPSAVADAVGARQAQAMAAMAQNQQALISVLNDVDSKIAHVQAMNNHNSMQIRMMQAATPRQRRQPPMKNLKR
jgi:hypothetical protein